MDAVNDPCESNRREFLTGEAAARALAGAGERLLDRQMPHDAGGRVECGKEASKHSASTSGSAEKPAEEESYLLRVARRAMACEFEVILNAGQHAGSTDLAIRALDLVEQLEEQMTVYRDSSEVTRINRQAADKWVPVEPRLFELFLRAAALHEATEGAFDITAGPLAQVWGFHQRQAALPEPSALRDALACVSMRHLMFDRDAGSIRFAMPGVKINLGAIGKGYALDRAAELLAQAGIDDFLLHGGQSSVLGRGSEAGGGRGWRVGIRDPLRINRRLAEIHLQGRALGTSGSAVQFFRHEGRRYGHILDPRTGWPAEGVLSATAMAPTATEADALATAFYVLGVEKTLDFCAKHPGIGAIVIGGSEGRGITGLHVAGLEAGEIEFLEPQC